MLDPTGAQPSALLTDLALSGINALILGETGVGKEVLAETLHRLSRRAGNLVCVNCAAIAPALVESELFGHEKGAFTGAATGRVGLLEAAEGGTVFLDEVGELPLEAQAKLLRALERREVMRVGAVKPLALDVRFVAATNRDLSSEVAAGQFRSDLYFRLDGVTLVVPPLRERRDQNRPAGAAVPARRRTRERPPAQGPQLAPDVLDHLRAYDWPGNVRELKAVLERALLLARGGEIRIEHLALTPHAASRPSRRRPLRRARRPPKSARRRRRYRDPPLGRRDRRAPPDYRGARALQRQPDTRGEAPRDLARDARQSTVALPHSASAQVAAERPRRHLSTRRADAVTRIRRGDRRSARRFG